MAERGDDTKDSNIKSTIDAVKGLAEAIPVYNDVVQPAAKEVGKSLAVVAKTVNIALAPVSALVWGFERIQEFVIARVSEKLKDVPKDKIITPDPAIVGPSLEALRYSGNDVNLRELYAGLVATSMCSDTLELAHPGFVEIIKNMSSDEAILFNYLYSNVNNQNSYPLIDVKLVMPNQPGENILKRNLSLLGKRALLKAPDLTPNYINNICRLGLMEIPSGQHLLQEAHYKPLFELDEIKDYKLFFEPKGGIIDFDKKFITITGLGRQFGNACIGASPIYIQL